MSNPVPRVGVAVLVPNSQHQILVGIRKGSHGTGTMALPGGHLEFGESFEDCARRELLEETALSLIDLRFLTATNDIMTEEGKHYITIFMTGKMENKQAMPQLMEPEKCEKWQWVSWDQIKQWETKQHKQQSGHDKMIAEEEKIPRLFLPLINLVRQQPELMSSLI